MQPERGPCIDELHFQGPFGEWALLASEQFEGRAEPLLLSVLVAFGAATGREPCFEIGADRHRANEFLAVLGGTGTGKGQTFNMVRRLFEQIDPAWAKVGLRSGLSSGEGLIGLVADPPPGASTPGTESRVKNVLVFEAEATRMFRAMKRETNTLSPILRDAWDGRSELSILTVSPVRATEPHLSVIIHSTGEELLSTMPPESLVNGFLNRFLLAENKISRQLPFGGDPSKIVPRELVPLLTKNLASARMTASVSMSTKARELWEAEYSRLTSPENGPIGDYKARGRAHARRLGMLFTLSEGLSEVEERHVEAAIAVWQYSLTVARRLLGGRNAVRRDPQEKILQALRDGPKNLTELHRVFGNNRHRDDLATWVEDLMRDGRIEADSLQVGKQGLRYRLKPDRDEFDERNELPQAS